MNEIELKFVIDERAARRLWARAEKLKLANNDRRTRTLRSVYWDTPEHALRDAGIALRLRREGRRWIQAVSTKGAPRAGLAQVDRLENAAPGGRVCLEAIPDASIRAEILHHVERSPLQPVCETLIKRTARELCLGEATRAELAIEAGEMRANGSSAAFREAVLELIDGSPSGLFDIAHVLFPDGGLRFSRLSERARGYLLAEKGQVEPLLTPRNAGVVVLDPAQTAEQAARDIVRECFDQIAANVAAVQQLDDPEGPHQLRVGLRRLRSAFSVLSPVLQSPESARLNDEARWLGQEVGRLRDLDVVANDIVRREAGMHLDEPGLAALADALSRDAAERRGHLRTCLAERRAQAFLIDLVRFVETRGWLMPRDFGQTERLATPVSVLADSALNKCWKKVNKRARGLEAMNADQRHELRKELKKLRYAVEFLAPLFPEKRVEPFVKRLKKLQTVFGDLNDAATVKALFAGAEVRSATDPQAQRMIGWVIGASQARAESGWTGAKALWRNLEDTQPFWK